MAMGMNIKPHTHVVHGGGNKEMRRLQGNIMGNGNECISGALSTHTMQYGLEHKKRGQNCNAVEGEEKEKNGIVNYLSGQVILQSIHYSTSCAPY